MADFVLASYYVPANRSGCIVAGGRHGESFQMNADFTQSLAPGGAACSCREYRQFVRGIFSFRPANQDQWYMIFHLLRWGLPLSPVYYYEDGLPNGLAYGYRALPGTPNDQYLPARATGCQYRGAGFPSVALVRGYQHEIHLDFFGEIIDVCNNETFVQGSNWAIRCQGIMEEIPRIQPARRLISNQQKLQGHAARVIFEYPKDNDNLIRLYVCFAKENDTKRIKRSSVQVFLMDTNGNRLTNTASWPSQGDEELVEASSFGTTAQVIFEFARSSGQNPLFSAVQLGEESANFQLKDAEPIPGLSEP